MNSFESLTKLGLSGIKMPLADFRANVDFSQSSLSSEGLPRPRQGRGNLGMAMLSEPRGSSRGASSAATELRKTFGAPPKAGKIDLSEKIAGFI